MSIDKKHPMYGINPKTRLRQSLGGVLTTSQIAFVEELFEISADDALEKAAGLHENIDPSCDHERQKGDPGAGAMGAVIEYRDSIRVLKPKVSE